MPRRQTAASALLFSTLLLPLLLAGGTTSAASNGDAASSNVTTVTVVAGGNNSSATVLADNNGPEMYTCYLCAGRNLLLIRWCPIYWDECHLVCRDEAASAAVPLDAGSGPVPAPVLPSEGGTLTDADPGDDDECYVMKLYNGGRYVIVAILKCGQVKTCGLTCGGGEVLGAGNAAHSSAAPVPAAAVFQHPQLADFQRCGDTVVRRGDRSDRKG